MTQIPVHYKDRRKEGDTVLRQCQLAQLHLLYVFDRICKDHGLQYVLEGGTLLGAMRHDGFIPWDDDLDVGMPQKDYEQFLRIAPKSLPVDVRLCLPSQTPWTAIPFAKLRDVYSFYGETRPDMTTADPSGIYIDIFPYEELPKLPRPIQNVLARVCSCSWMRMKFFYGKCRRGFLPCQFYSLIGLAFSVVHAMTRLMVWLLKHCLPSSDYCLGLECIWHYRFPKRVMFPAGLHRFEDGEFPVPADADAVLKIEYGDWHWIPPPEKRPRHARIIDPFHAA